MREENEAHRRILIEMQYTVRNIPRCIIRGAKRKRRTVPTISEAGPEVVRDGMVELFMDGIEEELLFSVGHEMMKREGRRREKGRLRGKGGKEVGKQVRT